MEKIFLCIYDFFLGKRRFLVFLIPLLLVVVFSFLARSLSLDEDIASFLPYRNGSTGKQGRFIYQNLRKQDKVIGLISLKENGKDTFQNIDRLAEAADDFAYRFEEANIEGVQNPMIRIDATKMLGVASFVAENMPYFLDSAEYSVMEEIVAKGDFYHALSRAKTALISSNGLLSDVVAADPFNFSSALMAKLSSLGTESGYKIIGEYLYTPDSCAIMMNFSSAFGGSETGGNSRMLAQVYAIRDSVTATYPDIKIEFTGSPVIAVMNAQTMKRDAITCACISIVLIVLLLLWYFRSVKPMLMICLPVLFGILAGLAFVRICQPSISAIALAACGVIFGIAVDYSLLYSTSLGFTGSARKTLAEIVSPMLIGNITTVGAFLSLLVMSASGMRDFGRFSAISLVGAILFVIIFLPHWAGEKVYRPQERGWMTKWAAMRPENHRFVFWILMAITVVFFFFGRRVTFSGDFTKINFMAPRQQQLLDELSSYTNTSGALAVYAVSEGDSLDGALEASEKNEKFISSMLSESKIVKTTGMGPFMPSATKQQQRLAKWKHFADKYGNALKKAVDTYGSEAGFNANAFDSFKQMLDADLTVRSKEFFSPVSDMLSSYILEDSLSKTFVMNILYTPKENIGNIYDLYSRYEGKAGDSFLFDSYSTTDEMIDILQADFNKVLAICSVLVFCFLWIAFRRLELALVAFLPMVISWIWIIGVMGIFGLSFNIVNIILATFIFGLGDDYTIFMVEGLQYEFTHRKPLLSSYKTGVTLSALTMFIGLGSLIFAAHPALASLGAVAVIGMVCVVALSFILPPVLFRFLVCKSMTKSREERIFPVRISDILVTAYCLTVFTAVSLWYKLITLFSKRLTDLKLRELICRKMRFFVKGLPRVSFFLKVGNNIYSGKEAFLQADKLFGEMGPVVIISNHQSHLDLLYLLALTPKILVMTNSWVYSSPVYGNFVRRCGYICADEGFEAMKERMQCGAKSSSNSFLLVFPEGTRSKNCSVMKFHSGAFLLAEELGKDILPVVLFGPGEVLPKGEHLLRRGKVVIEVKDRVPVEQLSILGSYALKRAQAMRHLYEEWYQDLKDSVYSDSTFAASRRHDFKLYKGSNEAV